MSFGMAFGGGNRWNGGGSMFGQTSALVYPEYGVQGAQDGGCTDMQVRLPCSCLAIEVPVK